LHPSLSVTPHMPHPSRSFGLITQIISLFCHSNVLPATVRIAFRRDDLLSVSAACSVGRRDRAESEMSEINWHAWHSCREQRSSWAAGSISSATGKSHSDVALHYRFEARTPVPRGQRYDWPTHWSDFEIAGCLTVDWDQWRTVGNETLGSVNTVQLLYILSASRLLFLVLFYFISTTET
jgi:hypothetical protein